MFEMIQQWGIGKPMIDTIILFVGFLIARLASIKTIRSWNKLGNENKRRFIVQIKNFTWVALFIGVLLIWGPELRTFAISLAAVAAAFVISTREMILCFLGGMFKAAVRPFEIGDHIQVGSYRGEVADHNFISTSLLEIGPGHDFHQLTGKQILIPNSMFFTQPIINECYGNDYVMHTFQIHLPPYRLDWKDAEQALVNSCLEVCTPFVMDAKSSFMRVERKEGLDLPSVEPRVSIRIDEEGEVFLLGRVPCPVRRVAKIEQMIIRGYLNRVSDKMKEWPGPHDLV